jgi:hypothetical protein
MVTRTVATCGGGVHHKKKFSFQQGKKFQTLKVVNYVN